MWPPGRHLSAPSWAPLSCGIAYIKSAIDRIGQEEEEDAQVCTWVSMCIFRDNNKMQWPNAAAVEIPNGNALFKCNNSSRLSSRFFFKWTFLLLRPIVVKCVNLGTYIFGIWILSASLWRPKSCHGRDRELLSVELREDAFKEEFGLPGTPPCTTDRWMFVTETGMEPPLASSMPEDWHSSV